MVLLSFNKSKNIINNNFKNFNVILSFSDFKNSINNNIKNLIVIFNTIKGINNN